MAGEIDKVKGQAKEAIGKAVGNRALVREGKRDQIAGAVKDGVAKIKKAVGDKIDETLDEREEEE